MNLISRIIRFLKNDEVEIRIRMLYLLEYAVILCCLIGTIAMVIIQQPFSAILPNFILAAVGIVGLLLSNAKKYEAATILLIIVCADLILPLMFFSAGGAKSGMPIWFVFGVVVACMMASGRSRMLMILITLMIDIACMLISLFWPEYVRPLVGVHAGFYDMLQSFVAVALGLCAIFNIHIYTYNKQRARLENQQRELSQIIRTDELTKVYNRHAYFEDSRQFAEKEIDSSLVLIVMDVNGLKNINDTRGHDVGDELLKYASQAIVDAFQSYGRIYRTGGDEFVALLHCSREETENLSQSLDEALQATGVINGKSITIARGIVAWRDHRDKTYRDVEKMADSQMYIDKSIYYLRNGNDRRKLKNTEGSFDSLFGGGMLEESSTMVDYLEQSSFDEKFELNLEENTIRNIFHVEGKYYVPLMTGNFRDMWEYGAEYMVHSDDGEHFYDFMNPDTMWDRLEQSDTPGVIRMECRQKLVDGEYRWVMYMGVSGERQGVPEGLIYFYVFDVQNQRDRLSGKKRTSHFSNARDEKTGLILSEMFMEKAKKVQEQWQEQWCCLAIDIQHFKIFNAWYGHEKGDYVLAKIGTVLQKLQEAENIITAYFGRDNFGVLMPHDEEKIRNIYNEIRDIIVSYSETLGFSPVIGVYLLEDQEYVDLDTYDKARTAVEVAKADYMNKIQYYDNESYHRKKEEFEILAEFQDALKNNEITFYVQPQCNITNGKIVGAEALARWIKKDGTLMSPGNFIPFLESSGFISELDKRVWEKVCQWIRELLNRGLNPVPVSINISQVDFVSMDIVAVLQNMTRKYQIPPQYIKVEITESAYAENVETMDQVITQLQEKGFLVFMDDFGSGYSSLNMLDQMKVDVLKLDMAFIRKESGLNKREISIIESIVSMARSLQIPFIVEGVETEEQMAFLHSIGCRYAQGYYFFKPMPLAQYENMLILEKEKFNYEGYMPKSTELFHTREFLYENIFTDTVLNNILGAVAFYALDGKDLTIHRFNEQFYRAIADDEMEERCVAIQHYVVKEDWPFLYRALEDAEKNISMGGSCDVRFFKSDGSVFWFHMHFFYLHAEHHKKIFYGQVEDVTENRIQSISFFEILRKRADTTMQINLDRNIIQYVTGSNTLYEYDLPSMDLDKSIEMTMKKRIDQEEDQEAFRRFFDADRLKAAYHKAVYHESLKIRFKLYDDFVPVEFSTYVIRYSKDQDLIVYAFVTRI